VWPNPASGIVDCRWSIVDGRGDFLLEMYDMYGIEIRKFLIPVSNHEIQMNVENLRPGLYLVVLRNGGNIVGSSKLIISR
ncbi:MAG TPA: T9SS type A sorting domain-containing protein, partial [Bacteroidales bacterium]|nr:T9SS type A sorting domain-containing protein [Bacteroidales bacterium]